MDKKEYDRQRYRANRAITLARSKQWYKDHKEEKQAYDKVHNQTPNRIANRRVYQRYHNLRIRDDAWFKLKRYVRTKVQAAIKQGILIRLPCEICGAKDSQAHHEDYNKPLDVRWFCNKHHIEHHRNNKENTK